MNLRKLKKSFGFAFAALLAVAALFCADAAQAEAKKIFEIDIPMQKGAEVTVTAANGKTFSVASVAALPTKTRYPSYTASAWGEPGSVCASAVNAVHMLVSVEKGRGRTLSIIPKETIAPAAGPGASIVLDAKAGESVFGAWAPAVGSHVSVRGADGSDAPLAADNLPKAGDTLVIEVFEDPSLPYMVDIENRPGGRVVAWYSDGYKILGRVLVALGGTGRFEGTLFQRVGAIRANHSGVIDVSTTPRGTTGGFQIVPWDHALASKEMQGVWSMTQWLVVGPADGKSKLGGTPPLFKHGLVSGPAGGEQLWDMWSSYGRRSMVLARYGNGGWERLHESAGRNDNSLRGITELRIYYPFTEEIQSGR